MFATAAIEPFEDRFCPSADFKVSAETHRFSEAAADDPFYAGYAGRTYSSEFGVQGSMGISVKGGNR